ncbi:MAG: hypothetical protein HY074_00320 [Deltaproteobacteria bacterium]|nr:hypothetical protein [Deltaproteobacteria bacterium]
MTHKTNDHHRPPQEVESHVRDTYLDQLPPRLARIKQLYIDRDWGRLKLECEKLSHGAENHGLPILAHTAQAAARAIPPDVDSLVFSLNDDSRTALFSLLESDGNR